MLLIIGLIFIILSIYGYRVSHVVYSPYTIMAGLWGIIIILYLISAPSFYPVENKFPYMILLWVVSFFFSSLMAERGTSLYLKNKTISQYALNKRIWHILLAIVIPISLYSIYTSITYAFHNPELFFLMLRSANTGADENYESSLGILSYFCTSLIILYLVALALRNNKKILWLLFIMNVVFSITTMAKSLFMQIFITSMVLLLSSSRIKKKHILFSGAGLVVFFIVMTTFRMADQPDNFDMKLFFDSYLFSGMVALDHLNIVPTEDGRYVFRFFYAIAHAFNNSVPVTEPILDYVTISQTGSVTNVYTGLFPFYHDFGWVGLFLFSLLLGGLAGVIFSFACHFVPFMIIYANVAFFISMEFLGDFWLINFSTFLQYVIYTFLLFKPTRIIQHD